MSRSRRVVLKCGAVTLGALAIVGCTLDPARQSGTVGLETAYVAIVRWEIEQREPVLGEDGDVETPVMYLASASGETVEVGLRVFDVVSCDGHVLR